MSKQTQDELSQPLNTPTLRDSYRAILVQQSEIVGTLELQVQTLSAQYALAQDRLDRERLFLRLLARYEAGIITFDEQQELYRLTIAPPDERGMHPDRISPFARVDEPVDVDQVSSEAGSTSTGMQNETIRPTDDLT